MGITVSRLLLKLKPLLCKANKDILNPGKRATQLMMEKKPVTITFSFSLNASLAS